MSPTYLDPIRWRQITVLRAIVRMGGEATPAQVREAVGGYVGGHLHALRNRSLIEPWMNVARVTPAGRVAAVGRRKKEE